MLVTLEKLLILHFTLKIYANYKLPVFGTNFLKLKFWKLLINSYCPKQLLILKMKFANQP